MSTPLVAIVGKPNVGKSTLYNRLIGAREAIVEDRPGVTRDRLYGVAQWDRRNFVVVDTGGLDPTLDSGLPVHIRAQVDIAIEEAELLLFVVDAVEGATSIDFEIATRLRRSGKPVLLVANKADSDARERLALITSELGLGDVLPVSAAHGRGVRELCDAIVERLPTHEGDIQLIPPGTRIAFLGRPNAGKSTLVNTILREARVVVDSTPGTTHDAIYLPFEFRNTPIVLIDTAGLRRRKQAARAMEKLAAIKSIRAMERTEVVVLVIDATAGVTDQDQRIARMAFERGKGVVVLLHKWDCIVDDQARAHACLTSVEEGLHFLEQPYIVKTSVVGPLRDQGGGRAVGLEQTIEACLKTARALSRRISTSDLNEELQRAVTEHSPPMHRGKPVRLYFATQADSSPPLIVVSANLGRSLEPAYERYLLRRIRARWDLRGVPIRIVVRARGRGGASPRSTTPAR